MTKEQLLPYKLSLLHLESGVPDIDLSQSMLRISIIFGKEGLIKRIKEETEKLSKVLNRKSGVLQRLVELNGKTNHLKNLRVYLGLQKKAAFAEHLRKELYHNEFKKVVVFCSNRDLVVMLRDDLKKSSALCAFGGSDPPKLEITLRKFEEDEKCILVCDVRGYQKYGASLRVADKIYVFDPDWDFSVNCAAIKSAESENLKEVVWVAAKDNIDKDIVQLLYDKALPYGSGLAKAVKTPHREVINPDLA